MSQPIQYFVGDRFEVLTNKFGTQLELLDRPQKLQLRAVLTNLVLGREHMGEDYDISDALIDFSELFVEDPQLEEIFRILQGVSVEDAENLQLALIEQCRHGNARLKTPIETQTQELKSHGVPEDLAKKVSYILVKVDNFRERTQEEQEAVSQVHKILMGVA